MFVEKSRVHGRLVLEGNQRMISQVRIEVGIGTTPVRIAESMAAVDDDIVVRVQWIWVDKYGCVRGSVHRAPGQRDLLSGPLERQLSDYPGNHTIAPWIAKQDQIIICDVGC